MRKEGRGGKVGYKMTEHLEDRSGVREFQSLETLARARQGEPKGRLARGSAFSPFCRERVEGLLMPLLAGGVEPPYQVQHGLHDVPVADLPDLNESDQHGKFHADVADGHGRINHPGGQHDRAGARCPQLPHHGRRGATAAASSSSSSDHRC